MNYCSGAKAKPTRIQRRVGLYFELETPCSDNCIPRCIPHGNNLKQISSKSRHRHVAHWATTLDVERNETALPPNVNTRRHAKLSSSHSRAENCSKTLRVLILDGDLVDGIMNQFAPGAPKSAKIREASFQHQTFYLITKSAQFVFLDVGRRIPG